MVSRVCSTQMLVEIYNKPSRVEAKCRNKKAPDVQAYKKIDFLFSHSLKMDKSKPMMAIT